MKPKDETPVLFFTFYLFFSSMKKKETCIKFPISTNFLQIFLVSSSWKKIAPLTSFSRISWTQRGSPLSLSLSPSRCGSRSFFQRSGTRGGVIPSVTADRYLLPINCPPPRIGIIRRWKFSVRKQLAPARDRRFAGNFRRTIFSHRHAYRFFDHYPSPPFILTGSCRIVDSKELGRERGRDRFEARARIILIGRNRGSGD